MHRDVPRTFMALAALARYPAGHVPFVWVDDPAPLSAADLTGSQGNVTGDGINVTVALALRDGLELVADPDLPPVKVADSWRVELDASSLLTIYAPSGQPDGDRFLWDLHLVTPPGWRDHARQRGVVMLMVGSGLHLTDGDRLYEHAATCARAGLLVSGLVPYTEPPLSPP